MSKIETLTPQQAYALDDTVEKWRAVLRCTKRCDREKAELAVRCAYDLAGFQEPSCFFWARSPSAALLMAEKPENRPHLNILARLASLRGNQLCELPRITASGFSCLFQGEFWSALRTASNALLSEKVRDQIEDKFRGLMTGADFSRQAQFHVEEQLFRTKDDTLEWRTEGFPKGAGYLPNIASQLGFYDYVRSLTQSRDLSPIEPFVVLGQECGWLWPCRNIALMTEKPVVFHTDASGRLHAEGRKALEYSDGFGMYFFRGVKIPDFMGAVKPEEWKSEWVLAERNAEVRRALTQGIGYEKIARDLGAVRLDSWREYELLRIDHADTEPIVFLRMTCPSTRLPHTTRVPPSIDTCRAAIRWCNWGIDKDDFLLEH